MPISSNVVAENNGESLSPWRSLSLTSTSYCPSWRPDPLRTSACPSTCAAAKLFSPSLEGAGPVGDATSSAHLDVVGVASTAAGDEVGIVIRSAREEGLDSSGIVKG